MIRLLLMILLLCSGSALAHKSSDSYLQLNAQQQLIDGSWDIALRDLEDAIGLDDNQDGQLSWGEVRRHQPDIAAYARQRLQLRNADTPCPLQIGAPALTRHTDGVYAALPVNARCASAIDRLEIDYRLLFDIDAQHRGLAKVSLDGQTHSLLFAPDRPLQRLAGRSFSDTLVEFAGQGIIHIWQGYDHILFLLSLLLPSVLIWQAGRWEAVAGLRNALLDVVKIVTAFTLAHSLTLTLATLGIIQLPSRWVESAIAASVIIVATNNLYPFIRGRRWVVAFGFGLIHGFGFAGVLSELQLPQSALIAALASFNLGVEIGQLAIVTLFVPLAYLLRPTRAYRQLGLQAGSLAIIGIAAIWLYERLMEQSLW